MITYREHLGSRHALRYEIFLGRLSVEEDDEKTQNEYKKEEKNH